MDHLVVQVLDPPMNKTGHTHPHAHILLPITKNLDVWYDGVQYHISPQELCFIPPNQYHHCFCPAEVITMNIPAHMIHQSELNTLEGHTVYPIEDDLALLIQLIKTEVLRSPPSTTIRYLFYYLYSRLVEENECRCLRHIREHFNEPLSIETLAQLEGYNPSYFSDWFHRKTGQSPSSYLRWFRIEKAKELLENAQYSILDVAVQVGYSGHAAFTRAFKDTTGLSPQEYRQQRLAVPGTDTL